MVDSDPMVTWKHGGQLLRHKAGIPLLFSTVMNVTLVPTADAANKGTVYPETVMTVHVYQIECNGQ